MIFEEVIGTEPRNGTVYDGFEPSGRLHIAQAFGPVIRERYFKTLGCDFLILLADEHAYLNGKGERVAIEENCQNMIRVWRKLGFEGVIHRASDLTHGRVPGQTGDYWEMVQEVMRKASVVRLMRCTPALGREETDTMPASALLYAAMQVVDHFALDVAASSMGSDQRKVNIMARDMYHPVPTLYFHRLVPSLKPGGKMSKSDPESAIFYGDTHEEVERKIRKAWCAPGERNGVSAILSDICVPWFGEVEVGGHTMKLEENILAKHPIDIKDAVIRYMGMMM